jgi:site-specific recombinase XerC
MAAAALGGSAMRTPISLAALLERFFTQRLMQQRQASPHTISSYRDTFHQFLKFTEQRLPKEPSRLNFQEIDAPLITAFRSLGEASGPQHRKVTPPQYSLPSLLSCMITSFIIHYSKGPALSR